MAFLEYNIYIFVPLYTCDRERERGGGGGGAEGGDGHIVQCPASLATYFQSGKDRGNEQHTDGVEYISLIHNLC